MNRFRHHSPLTPDAEETVTRTIGAGITVHTELGPGFLESIYKKAFALELTACGIPFESEKSITVNYRGTSIPGQRVDLVVADQFIVEVKAVPHLERIHEAQVISYLKTTGLRVGLLMNFHVEYLPQGLRRIAL
jgi:GxxExxY protein